MFSFSNPAHSVGVNKEGITKQVELLSGSRCCTVLRSIAVVLNWLQGMLLTILLVPYIIVRRFKFHEHLLILNKKFQSTFFLQKDRQD